jgi:hypothetical protein
MIATSPLLPNEATRSVERSVQTVYEQVNDLMKTLSD